MINCAEHTHGFDPYGHEYCSIQTQAALEVGKVRLELETERDALKLQVGEIQKRVDLQDFRVRYLREVLEKILSFRASGCSTGEAMSKTEFRAKEALEVIQDDCVDKRIQEPQKCKYCGQTPGWPHSPGCKNEPASKKFR